MISSPLTPAAVSRGHTPARRPRTQILAIAAVLLASVSAACSTATEPGALLNIDGTFTLVAVNGSPTPYHDPNTGLDVVRGTFTIHSTSRYDFVETYSGAAGLSTVSSAGQWTISNNTLTLTGDDNNLYLATLSGQHDTLTLAVGTHLSTYIKQ
jgi:hypothetical protein